MNYFNYERNITKEMELKKEILGNFGLRPLDKYNIINDPVGESVQILPYINNDYKTININYLAPSPGRLISLLEGAESIHFIEGCNVNFFYHAQYKNIFNYNKNIYFHVWLRNRDWKWEKTLNFDSAWKMMTDPTLENWKFIFDTSDLKKYF